MTTIQRSPDLGIGIRLQRIVEAKPVAAPSLKPQPPYWWGWSDKPNNPVTFLEIERQEYPTTYFPPGLWVAVVEGATQVTWEVTFTPKIWGDTDPSDRIHLVEAAGKAIPVALPKLGTAVIGADLFVTDSISFTAVLKGGGYEREFTTVGELPLIVASGNTISVMSKSIDLTGIITAIASVDGKVIGKAELVLKYVNQFAI